MSIDRNLGIEQKLKTEEEYAERILNLADIAFEQKEDYKTALNNAFKSVTERISPAKRKEVLKHVHGLNLYNYVFQVAEYKNEQRKDKAGIYKYPESEDFDEAWKFVMSAESKKLPRDIKDQVIDIAWVNVLADLVANAMEDGKTFIDACKQVFAEEGEDKLDYKEITSAIGSILGKRGSTKKEILKRQQVAAAEERKKYPLIAEMEKSDRI